MVFRACAVVGMLWLGGASSVSAEVATAREVEIDGAPAGEVLVNGNPVLYIRAADENLSPLDRAKIVAGRVNKLLQEGVVPEQITFREVKGETAVMFQDFVIATVDRATAAREGMDPMTLGEKWRTALVEALLSLEKPAAPPRRKKHAAATPSAPAIRRYVAENGMVFLLCALPGSGRAAVRVALRSGSLQDGDRLGYGLAFVVSQTAPLGTRRRTREQIQTELARLGSRLTVEAGYESVSYQLVVRKDATGDAAALLADLVQNATFPPEALQRAWAELSKLGATSGDAGARLDQALLATMFLRRPVRYPVRGRPEFRMLLQREELLDYYNRRYTPENAVCAVVGEFEPTAMLTKLRRLFSGWTYRPTPATALPAEPPQRAPRERVVVLPSGDEGGVLGWRAVPAWSPDAPAVRLLAAILGDDQTGRLRALEASRGGPARSLTVEAIAPGDDAGRLVVRWSAPAAQAPTIIAAIRREVARLTKEPVSEQERTAAVENLKQSLRRQAADPAAVCAQIVTGEIAAGAPALARRLVAAAEKLSAEDLRTVAARYLRPENSTVVTARRQK